MKHIKNQSPVSEKQWGFTKGKSTTGALLTAVESWHSELESGNDVCAVFCDFKKAFDIVHVTQFATTKAVCLRS